MLNNYAVIIQARMGSSRRPGKINYLFNNEPMLQYQIKRLQENGIDNIIVATSNIEKDDITEDIALNSNAKCFRGSENDVLGRFYECCLTNNVDIVIRVGGDDPLIDPNGIKQLISEYENKKTLDFLYTSHKNGWIYGTAAELFTFSSLKEANSITKCEFEREHINPYYRNNKDILKLELEAPVEIRRDDIYLSVDYQEDLDLVEQIIDYFTKENKRYSFTQKDLIELYDSDKLTINNKYLHDGF